VKPTDAAQHAAEQAASLHPLRRFLFFAFFADEGTIRRKQTEEQMHQAACLNLVTNAVMVWNTVDMQAVIDQLEADGYRVEGSDIAHLFTRALCPSQPLRQISLRCPDGAQPEGTPPPAEARGHASRP
jgi:hypothetical protein